MKKYKIEFWRAPGTARIDVAHDANLHKTETSTAELGPDGWNFSDPGEATVATEWVREKLAALLVGGRFRKHDGDESFSVARDYIRVQ